MNPEATAVQLEYASPQRLVTPQQRRLFSHLFTLAVLSGCCVASCFGVLANPLIFALPHAAVFISTIWVAIRCHIALQDALDPTQPDDRPLDLLNLLVLVALLIIGVAPAVAVLCRQSSLLLDVVAIFLGLAYAVLSIGSWRHTRDYRRLADLCRTLEQDALAENLLHLGGFKAMYETAWLACCAIPLLNFGIRDFNNWQGGPAVMFALLAVVGVVGYGGIWIWMLVLHYTLMKLPAKEEADDRAENAN